MDLWSLGVGGVMTSLLQIFVLILALLMIAWYFATALAKQYADAIKFLESKSLSKWVHNKTIQKARESLRITKQQKAHLQTLKQ